MQEDMGGDYDYYNEEAQSPSSYMREPEGQHVAASLSKSELDKYPGE